MAICANCGRESEGDFAFCPHCGAEFPEAKPAREVRKTVTVLFCDVAGSTSLGESIDPEALRALLHRFYERVKGIVEEHGGTVEKFAGDAVMAVFGVPIVHEDDPLDLVLNLMMWEHVRHVPVEDGQHRLVGLVTYRAVLRAASQWLHESEPRPAPVAGSAMRASSKVQLICN